MRICVIGAGYVGLITGLGLARLGNRVTCVDKSEAAIARLKSGSVHFFEPEADMHLAQCLRSGAIGFTTSIPEATEDCDIVFVAVGTPQMEDGQADVSSVFACCEEVARAARSGKAIVVKSTVPVGTCDKLADFLAGLREDASFPVVSNPEFLREGSAFHDFFNPTGW